LLFAWAKNPRGHGGGSGHGGTVGCFRGGPPFPLSIRRKNSRWRTAQSSPTCLALQGFFVFQKSWGPGLWGWGSRTPPRGRRPKVWGRVVRKGMFPFLNPVSIWTRVGGCGKRPSFSPKVKGGRFFFPPPRGRVRGPEKGRGARGSKGGAVHRGSGVRPRCPGGGNGGGERFLFFFFIFFSFLLLVWARPPQARARRGAGMDFLAQGGPRSF